MPVVTVTIKNHTPPEWEARITGATATFNHRGGGTSDDSKPNLNIPSGNGEAELHSANVDCIPSFRVVLAVRDRRDRVTIVDRSFRDPLGRECCTDQDVTLGQAALLEEIVKTFNLDKDQEGYSLENDK
ncbi:hypothetical protein [Methylobacterium tarhaniae]|uniref:hypothetical protein n=1 Tax=Methylobacterium tarhaniae TaxID=1187852 RepID=UPI003D06AF19